MLSIRNLTKIYKVKRQTVPALHNVNLELGDSGLVCIVGESGCGKSTLLNMISGYDKPTSGGVFVDGREIGTLDSAGDDIYRRNVGVVLQSSVFFEKDTVYQNVEFGLEAINEPLTSSDRADKIGRALDSVRCRELAERRVLELSGGQKQRVAIARMLVQSPAMILADEPTASLDDLNSNVVLGVMREYAKTHLVIVIIHDRELASRYADKIVYMRGGEIADVVDNAPQWLGGTDNMPLDEFEIKQAVDTQCEPKDVDAQLHSSSCGVVGHNAGVLENGDSGAVGSPIFVDNVGKGVGIRKSVLVRMSARGVTATPFKLVCMILIAVVLFGVASGCMIVARYNGRLSAIKEASRHKEISNVIRVGEEMWRDNGYFVGQNSRSLEDNEYDRIAAITDTLRVLSGTLRVPVDNNPLSSEWDQSIASTESVVVVGDNMDKLGFDLVHGRYPSAADEIVISDFVAEFFVRRGFVDGNGVEFDINNYDDILQYVQYKSYSVAVLHVVGIVSTDVDSKAYEGNNRYFKYIKHTTGKNIFETYDLGVYSSAFYTIVSEEYYNAAIGFFDANHYSYSKYALVRVGSSADKQIFTRKTVDSMTERLVVPKVVFGDYYISMENTAYGARYIELGAGLVTLLLSSILVIEYLLGTIKATRATLALLTTLGVKKKTILSVYLLGALLIALVVFAGTLVGASLFAGVLNYANIRFFGLGALDVIVIFAVLFSIATSGMALRSRRALRKQIADIVRFCRV